MNMKTATIEIEIITRDTLEIEIPDNWDMAKLTEYAKDSKNGLKIMGNPRVEDKGRALGLYNDVALLGGDTVKILGVHCEQNESEMKLWKKAGGDNSRYVCMLTHELDNIAKIPSNRNWYHYIMVDKYAIQERNFPIRVPGGTVGDIRFDKNNTIADIYINTNYVVKTYPDDLDFKIQHFIGMKLNLEDVNPCT